MTRDLRELKVAAAQNTREKDYWLNLFPGEPEKSNFPYDVIKTASQSHDKRLKEFFFKWEEPWFGKLMGLSKQNDHALHVLLTALLTALLGRYSGKDDITIGTPIYRQDREEEYINTVLALRTNLVHDITFKQLLGLVKQTLLEAIDHQAYPVELLPGFPLFTAALVLENIQPRQYLEHMDPDMVFHFSHSTRNIEAIVIYDGQLYRESTIIQVVTHLTRFMQNALSHPGEPISVIEILSEAEKKQLLLDFNNTQTGYPRDKTLHELFAEQVERTPGTIAVVGDAGGAGDAVRNSPISLTYAHVNDRADSLAGLLIEKGVRPGDIIGIMMERSIDLMIGILGILKANAAYLPIDPGYPQERIDYMLKDSHAAILLTDDEKEKTNNCQCSIVNCQLSMSMSIAPRLHHSKPQSLAYIIYTSGSTGQPKGVMVTHRNVLRLVKNSNFVPLNNETRILQTGAPVFDATTFENWGCLLNGGQLVLTAKEVILDAHRLALALAKHHTNTLWLSAPLFNQLIQEYSPLFKPLTYLLVGGDILSPEHINRARRQFPNLQIINGYGPTENTTFSTTYLIEKEFALNIPIGRPIANSTALILDKKMRLVPIGVAGELVVGGDGVARGYLNNPELTNDKFIWPPDFPKGLFYKTGDMARWLPEGIIEFHGRTDQQVKIRGFRIELAEIESQLRSHQEVKEAVVIGGTSPNGEKYLCAYFVPAHLNGKNPDIGELKEYLGQRLPDYMIPPFFVALSKIPLNRNGKIDRHALPEPFENPEGLYIAPRDTIEKELVIMFAEILNMKTECVGINTNFFKSGGHSLKAARLIAKMHRGFNVAVPVTQVFKTPTIAGLGQYIKNSREDRYTAIPAVEKKEYYLLSPIQKRFYVLHAMKGVNTAFNLAETVIIDGPLEIERWEKAFVLLIQRHESLRTSFTIKEGEPVQVVHEQVDFHIHRLEAKEKDLQDLVLSFIRPFDLKRAPLLRVKVINILPDKNLLYIETHHILSDGTSQVIMINDLLQLYQGKELPLLRIQYKDVAEWQRSPAGQAVASRYEKYWLDTFKENVPDLHLFTDYPRPVSQSFRGDRFLFSLPEDLCREIGYVREETGTTLFMFLLAALNVLLLKYTGNEDIVIGTPIAGRKDPEVENILGVFINPLALRNRPTKEKTFIEFLKEVKTNTLAAYENEAFPFDELIEKLNIKRDTGRNPLFDIDLVLLNMNLPGWEVGGLTITTYPYELKVTQMDIAFYVLEQQTETGMRIDFIMFYCTDLFKRETMERFAGYFKEIIGKIIENKNQPLKDIEIFCRLEKSQTGVYDSLEDF